jgi:hypothetical protein
MGKSRKFKIHKKPNKNKKTVNKNINSSEEKRIVGQIMHKNPDKCKKVYGSKNKKEYIKYINKADIKPLFNESCEYGFTVFKKLSG